MLHERSVWPHLLTVRKSGSHPGNRSSILLGVTTIKASTKAEAFIVVQREANGEFDNAALRTGVYSEHSARLYARRRYILLGVTKVKRPPKDGSLL